MTLKSPARLGDQLPAKVAGPEWVNIKYYANITVMSVLSIQVDQLEGAVTVALLAIILLNPVQLS